MTGLPTLLAATSDLKAPVIDWGALSPVLALLGGATLVLLLGLLRPRVIREAIVPILAIAAFGTAIGLGIWRWDDPLDVFVAQGSQGALRIDDLTIMITWIVCVGGIATVLLSLRAIAPREAAHGEYYALLLTSAAGMVVLAAAQNLVTVFLGLELLSIPLYVLCATEMRR
jgi:NADH-quinone oxidoreductase subunit N